MSDISEQEPDNTRGELSKALSSEVVKVERVSTYCSKIDITTTPAEKEERNVNKSSSCEINGEDDLKTTIVNLSKQIQELKQERLSTSFQHRRFTQILTYWDHYCLLTSCFSLVALSQISAACAKSWYWKLEFCVISFWFLLSLTLMKQVTCNVGIIFLLYVFLFWVFSRHDLYQVARSADSCAIYIIFLQFLTFDQATLYSAAYWGCGLLNCWDHVMQFCFFFVFFRMLLFIFVFLAEFSLHHHSVWVTLTCGK